MSFRQSEKADHRNSENQVVSQLLRQSNKIKKLSSELSKTHPDATAKLDAILYAAVQIEKIAKRVGKASQASQTSPYLENLIPVDASDEIYNQATATIEQLNSSMKKLTRKVDIVLSNARFPSTITEAQTPEHTGSRSRRRRTEQQQERRVKKTQKNAGDYDRARRGKVQFQQINQNDEENETSSLQAIDQEIYQIAQQLKMYQQSSNINGLIEDIQGRKRGKLAWSPNQL